MYRYLNQLILSFALISSASISHAQIESLEVSIKTVGEAFTPGAISPPEIPGRLNIPSGTKLPAVLILHGSNGIDSRGEYYAKELNANGIATLEIDMWKPRRVVGLSSRPKSFFDTLPDVWGAWLYLSKHPRIDENNIGVMGFSWGGILSVITGFQGKPKNAPEELSQAKFKANAPFYPSCTFMIGRARIPLSAKGPSGSPILLHVGSRDDYDNEGDCAKLNATFPTAPIRVVILDGATHGFDGNSAVSFYDPLAKDGRGGNIQVYPSPKAAEQARANVLTFFKETLR